eukprot:3249602-Rhodomonas_salina.1
MLALVPSRVPGGRIPNPGRIGTRHTGRNWYLIVKAILIPTGSWYPRHPAAGGPGPPAAGGPGRSPVGTSPGLAGGLRLEEPASEAHTGCQWPGEK